MKHITKYTCSLPYYKERKLWMSNVGTKNTDKGQIKWSHGPHLPMNYRLPDP